MNLAETLRTRLAYAKRRTHAALTHDDVMCDVSWLVPSLTIFLVPLLVYVVWTFLREFFSTPVTPVRCPVCGLRPDRPWDDVTQLEESTQDGDSKNGR